MGVDATLFVVANYSRDVLYAAAMIDLNRDYEAWEVLNALTAHRQAPVLQVMRGSFVSNSDGEKADDDRESGYLFGDSYSPDAGFSVFKVADIPVDKFAGPNRTILAFVREMWPAAEFLIIWH